MNGSRPPAVPGRLRVEGLLLEDGGVVVRASTRTRAAGCPVCGRSSRRVHGSYTRTLADLPWGGVSVRLRVTMRRDRATGGRTSTY